MLSLTVSSSSKLWKSSPQSHDSDSDNLDVELEEEEEDNDDVRAITQPLTVVTPCSANKSWEFEFFSHEDPLQESWEAGA